MAYVVTWLNDQHVVAEKEFDDLFRARDHVLNATCCYRRRGATSARVWNDRAIYFQFEWPESRSPKPDRRIH
jgi:hypothetical protein